MLLGVFYAHFSKNVQISDNQVQEQRIHRHHVLLAARYFFLVFLIVLMVVRLLMIDHEQK